MLTNSYFSFSKVFKSLVVVIALLLTSNAVTSNAWAACGRRCVNRVVHNAFNVVTGEVGEALYNPLSSMTGETQVLSDLDGSQKLIVNHEVPRTAAELENSTIKSADILREALRVATRQIARRGTPPARAAKQARRALRKMRRKNSGNGFSYRGFPTGPCEDTTLTVTYLGGSNPTSTKVTWRLDAGAETDLFGGADLDTLTPGHTEVIDLGNPNEALLTFTASNGQTTIESSDPEALLAGKGDSLSGLISLKGGTPGGAIDAFLAQYLNPQDQDTFDVTSNQLVLTFENEIPENSSFDDVGLLIVSSCSSSTAVEFTNRIGPDATLTNGGGLYAMTERCQNPDNTMCEEPGGDFTSLQFVIDEAEEFALTKIKLVAAATAFNANLIDIVNRGDWIVRAHQEGLATNPQCDNPGVDPCDERVVNYPLYHPQPLGTTRTDGRLLAEFAKPADVAPSFNRSNRIKIARNVDTYEIVISLEDNPLTIDGRTNVGVSFRSYEGNIKDTLSLVEAIGVTDTPSDHTCVGDNEPFQLVSGLAATRGEGWLGVAAFGEPVAVDVDQVVNLTLDENGKSASCWVEQDPTCTDNRLPLNSSTDGFSSYGLTALKLDVTAPTTISRFTGVGQSLSEIYTGMDLDLFVYSSEADFSADPGNTSFAHHYEDNLTLDNTNPPLFGGQDSNLGIPFRYLEISLPEFTLQPGTYYLLIVRVNDAGGLLWGHTTTDVGSGIYTSDSLAPQWRDFKVDFGLSPGTPAIDVYGRPAN